MSSQNLLAKRKIELGIKVRPVMNEKGVLIKQSDENLKLLFALGSRIAEEKVVNKSGLPDIQLFELDKQEKQDKMAVMDMIRFY